MQERPIVVVNEDLKECKTIDVAVPLDSRVSSKERERKLKSIET